MEVIGYEILTKIIRKGYFNADLEETSLWKPIVPMVNEEGLMDHFRGYIKGLNHQDFGQVGGRVWIPQGFEVDFVSKVRLCAYASNMKMQQIIKILLF